MLLNSGRTALKAVHVLRNGARNQVASVRNSHNVNYRSAPTPSKFITNASIAVQGYAWWWMLWHIITEPEHLTGEFPYPDPRKWTDEELGIPSSDC